MCTHGRCEIPAPGRLGVFHRREVLTDADYVVGSDTDLTIWKVAVNNLWATQRVKSYTA